MTTTDNALRIEGMGRAAKLCDFYYLAGGAQDAIRAEIERLRREGRC